MRYIVVILVMLMFVNVLGCKNTGAENPDIPEEVDEEADEMEDIQGVWLTDYDQAVSAAKKRNLPVLINFSGSDWCFWCQKLDDEVFDTEEFKAYAKDDFVLLNLDFPKKTEQSEEVQKANQALAKRYGVKGFPTVILLNSEGEIIGETGYREGGPKPYIEHLKEMIK